MHNKKPDTAKILTVQHILTTNFASLIAYRNIKEAGFDPVFIPTCTRLFSRLRVRSANMLICGEFISCRNLLVNGSHSANIIYQTLKLIHHTKQSIFFYIDTILNILVSLKKGMRSKMTPMQTFILIALWKNRTIDNKISIERGYDVTLRLCKHFKQAIDYDTYCAEINKLMKQKSILLINGVIIFLDKVHICQQ